MIDYVLLNREERNSLLSMCYLQLNLLRLNETVPQAVKKLTCKHVGLIICQLKGVTPHFNERYIVAVEGWNSWLIKWAKGLEC